MAKREGKQNHEEHPPLQNFAIAISAEGHEHKHNINHMTSYLYSLWQDIKMK